MEFQFSHIWQYWKLQALNVVLRLAWMQTVLGFYQAFKSVPLPFNYDEEDKDA